MECQLAVHYVLFHGYDFDYHENNPITQEELNDTDPQSGLNAFFSTWALNTPEQKKALSYRFRATQHPEQGFGPSGTSYLKPADFGTWKHDKQVEIDEHYRDHADFNVLYLVL